MSLSVCTFDFCDDCREEVCERDKTDEVGKESSNREVPEMDGFNGRDGGFLDEEYDKVVERDKQLSEGVERQNDSRVEEEVTKQVEVDGNDVDGVNGTSERKDDDEEIQVRLLNIDESLSLRWHWLNFATKELLTLLSLFSAFRFSLLVVSVAVLLPEMLSAATAIVPSPP